MKLNISLKSTWRLARTEERAQMVLYALLIMLNGGLVIGMTVDSQRDVVLLLACLLTMFAAANGLQVIRRDIVIRLLTVALRRKGAQP
jgi:hypothetical protein